MSILRNRVTRGSGVLACILLLQSCMQGKRLMTEPAGRAELQGTYALILYGGNYSGDLETVAILDREGDRYVFEPYAPPFNYRVIKGQTADHALPAAKQFVRRSPSYQGEELRAILDESGAVIGYELRPLYLPFVYGISDILDIDYRISGDRVTAVIRLKPFVEQQQDGADFRHGGRGNKY